MKDVQGACKFCGQFRAMQVPDSFTQADIDEEATKKCDCVDAQADTRIKENIANTEGTIGEFFKDKEGLEELKELLLTAVKPLAEYKISSISVSKGPYTGTMKPGKDGIKILLKYTTTDSVES